MSKPVIAADKFSELNTALSGFQLKACLEENHQQDGRGRGAAANLIPADVDAVLTLCGFTNDNDRRKFWLAEGWAETVDLGMFSCIKKLK